VSRPVVLSLGGGLDSWVMLLEAVRRGERIDVVVFVDVGHAGDPGEWPSTYRHVEEVVRPFCAQHGIELVVIDGDRYPVRDARSLFAWLEARDQIPVAGPNRICTRIAKVERFERWMDERFPGQEVEVWIGFEAGEEARAEKDPNAGGERGPTGMRARSLHPRRQMDVLPNILHNASLWTRALAFAMSTARRINRFPLMTWGLCRCRCETIARASGYPVPRKSACVFCPYGTKGDWQRFAVDLPAEFDRVAELEIRKPLTSNGRKLSIMAYDSTHQRGTPIREFVAKPYTRQAKPCGVCGAAARATKATGCDYLPAPA
jgi:3'-phosphoadenosine 5'-phosphosulfate sulfotransferase (PAPS reductase)/FAD synthetase